jgi:hypothetical protein
MPGIEGIEREDLDDREVRGIIRSRVRPRRAARLPRRVATIAVRGVLRGAGD